MFVREKKTDACLKTHWSEHGVIHRCYKRKKLKTISCYYCCRPWHFSIWANTAVVQKAGTVRYLHTCEPSFTVSAVVFRSFNIQQGDMGISMHSCQLSSLFSYDDCRAWNNNPHSSQLTFKSPFVELHCFCSRFHALKCGLWLGQLWVELAHWKTLSLRCKTVLFPLQSMGNK